MGRQIKGLLYFFITDSIKALTIFWGILTGTIIISTIIAFAIVDVADTKMIFAIPAVLYIFCAIYGFKVAANLIPFSIRMGATRKNIFISLGIFFLGLAIFKAILGSTIQTAFTYLNRAFGIDTYAFLHPAQLLSDTWLTRVAIDTSMMFCILSVLFLLGFIYYRYGLFAGGTIPAIMFIVLLLGISKGWILDYLVHLSNTLTLGYFFGVFAIGVLIYMISWFMTRNVTVAK
ncbi:hypothetical protein ACFSMW_20325 [Virgibacillus halophilus]|uniref:hypothetical protein n=1 Tax=Tigheibacillus halophilus TaxID=361280 RepID=UPI003628834F